MTTKRKELIEKAHFEHLKAGLMVRDGQDKPERAIEGVFCTLDRPVARVRLFIDHEPAGVSVEYFGGENGEQLFRDFARAVGYAPRRRDAPFDTATAAGRALNRWIEAVILPQAMAQQKFRAADADGADGK